MKDWPSFILDKEIILYYVQVHLKYFLGTVFPSATKDSDVQKTKTKTSIFHIKFYFLKIVMVVKRKASLMCSIKQITPRTTVLTYLVYEDSINYNPILVRMASDLEMHICLILCLPCEWHALVIWLLTVWFHARFRLLSCRDPYWNGHLSPAPPVMPITHSCG